jgi:cell division protein ZapA
MSQSVVTIRLNGHPYQIGCGAGEENHVARLGNEVEAVIQSLTASLGQIGEARLLAMVALILADRNAAPSDASDDMAAGALEDAAERIAALASKLASGATSF